MVYGVDVVLGIVIVDASGDQVGIIIGYAQIRDSVGYCVGMPEECVHLTAVIRKNVSVIVAVSEVIEARVSVIEIGVIRRKPDKRVFHDIADADTIH